VYTSIKLEDHIETIKSDLQSYTIKHNYKNQDYRDQPFWTDKASSEFCEKLCKNGNKCFYTVRNVSICIITNIGVLFMLHNNPYHIMPMGGTYNRYKNKLLKK